MSMSSPPGSNQGSGKSDGTDHLDEMSCMLYLEGQLDRARAMEVSNHTQTCAACRTLLRAIERESRLLTRAMLEEEEPLPARIANFKEQVHRSMQWIWMVVFGLAATAVYAMYTGYIEPWQQRLEQAGFGGTSLLSMLIFQGSFWKGWQSMLSLVEVLALVTIGGFAAHVLRKRIRRGGALALVLTSLCTVFASAPAASAAEFRKGASFEVAKDETVKGDLYFTGQQLSVDGTVDGDLYVWGQEVTIRGHVTGDVFAFVQTARIDGQVDGSVRGFCNNITISGTVDRSLMAWAQVIHVDNHGSVGRTVTAFSQTLSIDGKVARDMLVFNQSTRISGTIGGSVKERGESLTIEESAQVNGSFQFEGEKEPIVSKSAKLASAVQFTHHVKKRDEFSKHSAFWAGLLAAAFVLFGLVLFRVMPQFSLDATRAAESYGADCFANRLRHFCRIICWAFHFCVVADCAVRRANGCGHGDRPVDPRPRYGHLGPHRSHGSGRFDYSRRHADSARRMDQARRSAVGHGRDFAGAVSPPPAACGSSTSVCSAADGANRDRSRGVRQF
jgi:cytoskeletal protein CcmA (bactofilin family)